jgi:hypothetical protein
MTNKPISKIPERNPVTYEAHRRQVFWQITFPFVIVIIIIAALVLITLIAAAGNSSGVSKWADISLIWIILPTLVINLIPLALIGALAYGMIRLIGILPGYARIAQDFLSTVRVKARSYANTAAKPVIKTGSFMAGVKALFKGR